jgi:hypothetical protein
VDDVGDLVDGADRELNVVRAPAGSGVRADSGYLESIIDKLILDETYLSPPVPTLRFGFPALLRVTGPLFGPDDSVVTPFQWIVIDVGAGVLAAFARTEVVSPLPDWEPPPTAGDEPAMSSRQALEEFRRFDTTVTDAFFSGAEVQPEERRRYATALRTMIPRALRPWLGACCDDFWGWADTPTGPDLR